MVQVLLLVQRGGITWKHQVKRCKKYHVKALLVLKTKQTFHRTSFGVVGRKTHEVFYC